MTEFAVMTAPEPVEDAEPELQRWYTLRAHARNFVLKLRNTQVGVYRETSSASFSRSCVA